MRHTLLLFALLAIVSCGGAKEKEKENDDEVLIDEVLIGDYVYLDTDGILHVKNRCVMGLNVTDKNGESCYKGVHRIKVSSLTEYYLRQVMTCAWCVDDESYELLIDAVGE